MDVRNVLIDEDVNYLRHEYHYEPEKAVGDLVSLVYDIPYFGACGVFPPIHIANKTFRSGGGDGGMSPGASWEPFVLTETTYSELVAKVKETDPRILKGKSRYYHIKYVFDESFDSIDDEYVWLENVCNKHRARFHAENARINDDV